MANYIESLENGSIMECEKCGERFFMSYEENSCQCSGCSDNNSHQCKVDKKT